MINLLPYKQKKIVYISQKIQMALIIIMGITLTLIVVVILLSPISFFVNTKLVQIQKQSMDLGEGDMNTLNTSILSLEKKVTFLKTKLGNENVPDPIYIISTVTSQTNKGINIDTYSVSDSTQKTVLVTGTSKTRSDLENFTQTLRNLPGVDSIDSPISNFVKNSDNDFSITVVFKK